MKIAAIIPVALGLMNGQAEGIERTTERHLSVCLQRASGTEVEQFAQGRAARILAEIGVGIEWNCSGGSREAITIGFSDSTPDEELPGALAYAQPFAGSILVFRDRIDKFLPQMRALVLAYVFAHEIGHVLQGLVRHSDSGIMKAHWDRADLGEMFSGNLKFTRYDVSLIHTGMDADLSHRTGGLLARVN